MSEHGPNAPQRQAVESMDAEGARGDVDDIAPRHDNQAGQSGPARGKAAPRDAEPGDAESGDAESGNAARDDRGQGAESAVRVGSPFAVDPFAHHAARPVETLYDVGPMRYTAMGAVSASVMVVGFAAAATYFFPVGGAMIAALGCVLSIFGMYSSYRFTAAGLLAIHLCLFVLSYGRTLS